MNYKLINKQTGQETLCSKVILDGWDYYVSGDFKVGDKVRLKSDINVGQVIDDLNKDWSNFWFNPIATNNPNVDDIPKVVDEIDNIIKNAFYDEKGDFKRSTIGADDWVNGLKLGYNKSQETHSFSEEDMIEFLEWVIFNYPNQWKSVRTLNTKGFYSTKELLQLWKEQQPKIIWYE